MRETGLVKGRFIEEKKQTVLTLEIEYGRSPRWRVRTELHCYLCALGSLSSALVNTLHRTTARMRAEQSSSMSSPCVRLNTEQPKTGPFFSGVGFVCLAYQSCENNRVCIASSLFQVVHHIWVLRPDGTQPCVLITMASG